MTEDQAREIAAVVWTTLLSNGAGVWAVDRGDLTDVRSAVRKHARAQHTCVRTEVLGPEDATSDRVLFVRLGDHPTHQA